MQLRLFVIHGLALSASLSFLSLAQATTSVESATEIGTTSSSETISGDGDFDDFNSWNVSLNTSRSETTDPTSQQTIVDHSSEIMLGADHSGDSNWSFGGGLAYGITPDENLTQFGPNFDIGYQTKLSSSGEDEGTTKHAFSPSLKTSLTLSALAYSQSFTGTSSRAHVPRPINGRNEITQSSAQLSLKVRPVKWVSTKVYVTGYRYNRDVNQFIQYLDTVRLGQPGGLSNTASSFPSSEAGLSVRFYIAESWEVTLSGSTSKTAYDGSTTSTGKAEVSNDITENLTIGLGAKTLHASTYDDRAATVRVAYEF